MKSLNPVCQSETSTLNGRSSRVIAEASVDSSNGFCVSDETQHGMGKQDASNDVGTRSCHCIFCLEQKPQLSFIHLQGVTSLLLKEERWTGAKSESY